MKHEFWAEFDLYKSLATAGIRIQKLQDDIQREQNNNKKARLSAKLRQLQREAQDKVTK